MSSVSPVCGGVGVPCVQEGLTVSGRMVIVFRWGNSMSNGVFGMRRGASDKGGSGSRPCQQGMKTKRRPLCRFPDLDNRLLSRTLSLRHPKLAAPHLLSNRFLGTGIHQTLSRSLTPLPLCFSRTLTPKLPSALCPSSFQTLGAKSDRRSVAAEEPRPYLGPPENWDVPQRQDPVEPDAHMPICDLSAQEYEDLAEATGESGPPELHDVPEPSADQAACLRKKKESLLEAVCSSLLQGPNFTNPSDPTRQLLLNLCREVAEDDPEFLLKVALYARHELNIRSVANFLLAVGALLPSVRPHLRRYFARAVRLPSDWLQVPRLFQSLANSPKTFGPFPSCLRQGLTDSFRTFDEYQLAKYNSRRQRCKAQKRRSSGGRLNPDRGEKMKPADPFTLKKLVQWLHLREPANHIMCLLGRRYPCDLQSFAKARLPGPWDSQRAGTRMKLPVPDTWERELCLHGNSARCWERLIDNQKLPFMAALRNLRNMISRGLSARHHRKLLAQFSDERCIVHSRQFPFRFLTALRVVSKLREALEHKDNPLPSRRKLMLKALSSLRIQGRGRSRFRGSRPGSQATHPDPIPILSRQVAKQLKRLQELRNVHYDQDLLDQYSQALEKALEISATHNLPPLPGRTVVLCAVEPSMKQPCLGARDLLPRGAPSPDTVPQAGAPTVLEVAALLGLMTARLSETSRLVLCSQHSYRGLDLPRGSLLTGLDRILQEAKNLEAVGDESYKISGFASFFLDCIRDHEQIDTVLLLGSGFPICDIIPVYRYHVNHNLLFLQVDLSIQRASLISAFTDCKNDIFLYGFSDQILRFLCERGSSRLLNHVNRMDDIFHLPKPKDGSHIPGDREASGLGDIIHSPTLRWWTVRVFVSSTFRDMQSERDLLVGSVFPELRARAARHAIHLREIDLRWGITEEESRGNRQLELCLSEVSRCQLFLLLLGERYGHIPVDYSLPDLPHFQWVKDYPKGRSVTELELKQFLRQNADNPRQSCFVYTRDPAVLRSIPDQWRSDFCAESEEAKFHLAELKQEVKERELLALANYSSEWRGQFHGMPYLGGLEEFGNNVLRYLWGAILDQHCQAQPTLEQARDEDTLQERFLECRSSQFCGRSRLLSAVSAAIYQHGDGRLLLLHGQPSQGKTAFMAGLITHLRGKETGGKCDLLYHFTEATEGAQDGEGFLRRACAQLDRGAQQAWFLQGYRSLVSLFHRLLSSPDRRQTPTRLVVLIDGAERLLGPGGAPSSDWVPEPIPLGITVVLSVTDDSPLHRVLAKHQQVVTFQLGPLDRLDRSEVVRRSLAIYGKRLDESAFNNQMRLLMGKKDSDQPLFLKMASEDLRSFGVFEKVTERIREIPSTLHQMLELILGKLEQEFGTEMVHVTLVSLSINERGLREGDLYAILCTHWSLHGAEPLPHWNEVMRETLQPSSPISMATFARLLRGLESVTGMWRPADTTTSRLRLTSILLRRAVDQRYLRDETKIRRWSGIGSGSRTAIGSQREIKSRLCHLLLAAHLWRLTDPSGDRTFFQPDPEALADLPLHLVKAGESPRLQSLLLDLRFSWLHLRLRMLPQLGAAFALCGPALHRGEKGEGRMDGPLPDSAMPIRDFISLHWHLFFRDPLLFWQTALNQEDSSPVAQQAQSLLGPRIRPNAAGFRLIRWANKQQHPVSKPSRVMRVGAKPECVALCPGGEMCVVATSEGSLHLLHLESGQELRSVASGCDGISDCAVLQGSLTCAASFDGKLEVWDLSEGCRYRILEAHSGRITGCAISPDGKQLATSSWDRSVKVWDSSLGVLQVELTGPSPLNCVAFHPHGQLVSAGGWDQTVRLWNWVTACLVWVLHGHQSAVRALSFCPDGEGLVSASLLGDVLHWCLETGCPAGGYQAHWGPVTSLHFLDGGRLLLSTGDDQQVRVWSGSLGQRCQEFREGGESPALCLSVSDPGGLVAVGYHDGRVKVFVVRTGELSAESEVSRLPVWCVLWLSGEELLATGGEDGRLGVWRLKEGSIQSKALGQGHLGPLVSLTQSQELLASASADSQVLLWTLEKLTAPGAGGELVPTHVLRGHSDSVTCCSFSPEGRQLVSGSKDKSLLVWDLGNSAPATSRCRGSAHRDWVTGCCWGLHYLASCSNDGLVRLWDPESMECIREFKGHTSSLSGISIMAGFVISATGDGDLLVWKDSGVTVTSIPAHACGINHVTAYHHTNAATKSEGCLQVLTAADDGTVRSWDPLLPEEVVTLRDHGASVRGAATHDGLPFFLTVAEDRTLRLWDIPQRPGLWSPPHHQSTVTALCFSPSGNLLVSGSQSGELILWDSEIVSVKIQPHKKRISSISFLLETEFAVGSYDAGVSTWSVSCDPRSGEPRLSPMHCLQLSWGVRALASLGKHHLLISDLSGGLTICDLVTGCQALLLQSYHLLFPQLVERPDGSVLGVTSSWMFTVHRPDPSLREGALLEAKGPEGWDWGPENQDSNQEGRDLDRENQDSNQGRNSDWENRDSDQGQDSNQENQDSDQGRDLDRENQDSNQGRNSDWENRDSDQGQDLNQENQDSDQGRDLDRENQDSNQGRNSDWENRDSDQGQDSNQENQDSDQGRDSDRENRDSDQGRKSDRENRDSDQEGQDPDRENRDSDQEGQDPDRHSDCENRESEREGLDSHLENWDQEVQESYREDQDANLGKWDSDPEDRDSNQKPQKLESEEFPGVQDWDQDSQPGGQDDPVERLKKEIIIQTSTSKLPCIPQNTSARLTAVLDCHAARGAETSLFFADSEGGLWHQPGDSTQQTRKRGFREYSKKQVHSDRVSAVAETEDIIATASFDQTVRLWDRETLKQVGLFPCQSAVQCLMVNPSSPAQLACGDDSGTVYFLHWCPPGGPS
ncbi:telomerase protein component 1 isoform X3 [Narcine bancroftii]|uniref:telomerase protein component 1 isoform X3 n=1 Tax=Narcine bancroftii TaxID=1343680 RepID=UPI0038319C9D